MAAPEDWLAAYIKEDLGDGDVTSNAIFDHEETGHAVMRARERAFLAGIHVAVDVFARFGVHAQALAPDASWVEPGNEVLAVEGPVRGILAAERLALNMVGRMSGIATMTRMLNDRLADERAVVAATRKTTPGFRRYEKMAVLLGGGDAHRDGLWDVAMVKDNHIAAAGDVAKAVQAVIDARPDVQVVCEADTLAQARAAAAAGAHWVLIDNQEPHVGKAWAEAVWKDHAHVRIEASGGITPDRVQEYGWADRISLGALTNRARSMDFGLDWGAT